MNLPKFDFKNTMVRNIAIMVAIGIAIGSGWYYGMYESRQKDKANLKVEQEKKQIELNQIRSLRPQLEKLLRDTAEARKTLDSLKSIFPDQKEIPNLINQITTVARASGISTTRFTPAPDIVRDYYVENRYDMAATGGYHQLGAFFAYLANLQLLVNLSEVNIRAGDAGARPDMIEQDPNLPTITATFKMTTFSSKK